MSTISLTKRSEPGSSASGTVPCGAWLKAKPATASKMIIAVEPKEYVDIRQQFYLLPILEARETALANGFRVKSVEVASVTAKEDTKIAETAPEPPEATPPKVAAAPWSYP